MPNGRSRGKRRGRRPKRSKDEKGGRTVNTAAPALFAFMGPLSSSGSLSVWRWACAALRCGNGWFRNGQRKAIIRTHHRLEIGSDYIGLVRLMGLEPIRSPIRPSNVRVCLFRHNRISELNFIHSLTAWAIIQHRIPNVKSFMRTKLIYFASHARLCFCKAAKYITVMMIKRIKAVFIHASAYFTHKFVIEVQVMKHAQTHSKSLIRF